MNKNNFIKHPLNKKSVNELINYENLYKKNMNKSYFDKIIEIYTLLVEYYDANSDPMKNYFLEKIQDYTLIYNSKLNEDLIIHKPINKKVTIYDYDTRKAFRAKKYVYDQNKKQLIEENKSVQENKKSINNDDLINAKIKLIETEKNNQIGSLKLRLLRRKEKSFNKTINNSNQLNLSYNSNNLSNILDDFNESKNFKYMDIIQEEKEIKDNFIN